MPNTTTPEQAAALLAALRAEHGPGVLAALLGACFAEDVRTSDAEAEQHGDEPTGFDRGWLAAFAEHPAFADAAGPAFDRLNLWSCEF
jgi:hypothetical protein